MIRDVDEQFIQIARMIVAAGWTETEWAAHESSDWVQDEPYHGGFDATERAFCFSVYVSGAEYWFQLTLEEVGAVANGHLPTLSLRPAE